MNNMPNESIWGTINTCFEIALDIYLIVSENKEGLEQVGIMAHQDAVPGRLSEKAAEMAQKEGEWYYFDENTKDVPLYEALQQKLEYYRKLETETVKELENIKQTGQNFLSGYFGTCPPPEEMNQKAYKCREIRNGIYFVEEADTGKVRLAVHKSIANYMTAAATARGAFSENEEYLQYGLPGSAVPLNELQHVFPEVEQLIISPDSLNATLCGQFGEYLEEYNQLVSAEKRISETDAPANLFLSMQLERENDRRTPDSETEAEVETTAEVEDYGEQVEYGFEQ